MGSNGKRLVENEYNWEKEGIKIVNAIKEIYSVS